MLLVSILSNSAAERLKTRLDQAEPRLDLLLNKGYRTLSFCEGLQTARSSHC